MPYVPPHLRKKNIVQNIRRKALVIPMINNKYIVAKNRQSGNTTFMGGGCKGSENIRNCARKELREESRHSIKNTNFEKLFIVRVTPEYRSNRELAQNKNRGLYVITNYHVFSLKLKNSFKNIHNRFHAFNPKTKSEMEMSNIMLKSLNNLNKNQKLWILMREKILPELKK